MTLHDHMMQVLYKARETYLERNEAYSQGETFGFEKHAAMMMGLFPGGVTIKTVEEMARFILFIMVTVKVTRYAEFMPRNGHEDSAHDLAVYSLLLEAYDETVKGKKS